MLSPGHDDHLDGFCTLSLGCKTVTSRGQHPYTRAFPAPWEDKGAYELDGTEKSGKWEAVQNLEEFDFLLYSHSGISQGFLKIPLAYISLTATLQA